MKTIRHTTMSSLKDLLDKVVAQVSSIEEHNAKLCEALQSLLNEDDIKELPAYELLKMTYGPYLNYATAPSVKITNNNTVEQLYDPLHAPPNARFGKKAVSVNPKRPIISPAPTSVSVAETHYSTEMPDMDTCLLGGPVKSSKPAMKKEAKEAMKETPAPAAMKPIEPLKIQPKTGESVYRVEIQGKNYLRYNEYLYDENNKRVGSVTDFKLGSTTPVLELEPVPDAPEYYMHDTTVYILVNNEIAQAVGTYENGEIALWS